MVHENTKSKQRQPSGRLLFLAPLFIAVLLGVGLISSLAMPHRAAADEDTPPVDDSYLVDPEDDCKGDLSTGNCKIMSYIVLGINVLSATVGVVVVGMVIAGGIQYSVSGDDPQAVAKAKSRISSALLALVVFIFSYAFLQWIVPGGIL